MQPYRREALLCRAARNRLVDGGAYEDAAARTRDAFRFLLFADIDHVRVARRIKMRQFVCHEMHLILGKR